MLIILRRPDMFDTWPEVTHAAHKKDYTGNVLSDLTSEIHLTDLETQWGQKLWNLRMFPVQALLPQFHDL